MSLNLAHINVSLAENFYEVFIAYPMEEQEVLLEEAQTVSVSDQFSIHGHPSRSSQEDFGAQSHWINHA